MSRGEPPSLQSRHTPEENGENTENNVLLAMYYVHGTKRYFKTRFWTLFISWVMDTCSNDNIWIAP